MTDTTDKKPMDSEQGSGVCSPEETKAPATPPKPATPPADGN
jgi:hypothetical protein